MDDAVRVASSEARIRRLSKRTRRRARRLAAATAAVTLVPLVLAGEPNAWLPTADGASQQSTNSAGDSMIGLGDADDIGADGRASHQREVGQQVLSDAGDVLQLALGAGPGVQLPSGPLGIPGTMLRAYMKAAQQMATIAPNCHLSWPLVASIGRIESNHAGGGRIDAKGFTAGPILGPVLDGAGFAAIADTDGGVFDGDARWDRAVGPMQFIPSTWRQYAADGNGDGVSSPHNVFDAALAAGKYLCSGGLNLADPQQQAVAVFRYNHSDDYVRTVLIWADAYAKGVQPVPTTPVTSATTVLPPPPPPPVPPTPSVPPTTTTTTTRPSGTSSSQPPSSSCTPASSTDPSTSAGPSTSADPSATTTPEPTSAPPSTTTDPTSATTTTPPPCA